ncbi:MAG TPA: heme-binding protein [Steroidobacteraceae bacterium]|nr:heme-binding protein [Steroidobacteraceae bacterium]
MASEEPRYQLIEHDGHFELREYEPYLLAETRVEAGFDAAGGIAFRRLFDYISGRNTAAAKIAMTAPVIQGRGEKIAMTAPVAMEADGAGYRVAFVVPSKYTAATVPTPLDERIVIRAVPARIVACWRYSGRWTERRYQAFERALRAAIEARGLRVQGAPMLARYNPPFTPWPLRRNEVLIPVARARSR